MLQDTQTLIFSASDITMPRSFVVLPKTGLDHETAWKFAQEYADTLTGLAKDLVGKEEAGSLESTKAVLEGAVESVLHPTEATVDSLVAFLVNHVSGNVSLTTNSILVHLLCEGCWKPQAGGYEITQPKSWVTRLAPALSAVLFVTAGLGVAAQVLMPPAVVATNAVQAAARNLQKVAQNKTPELVKAALNAGLQSQDVSIISLSICVILVVASPGPTMR